MSASFWPAPMQAVTPSRQGLKVFVAEDTRMRREKRRKIAERLTGVRVIGGHTCSGEDALPCRREEELRANAVLGAVCKSGQFDREEEGGGRTYQVKLPLASQVRAVESHLMQASVCGSL